MLKKCIEEMENVYGAFNNVGLSGVYKPKPLKSATQTRYLWTDAFAVCNFLSLHLETGQDQYLQQARALIDEVHNVLGRDRKLKNRLGKSNEEHPLLGGLRIGKEYDEDEDDGDGQYFHYNTKWMFALSRMSLITSDVKYNRWAIEMAQSMHNCFMNRNTSSSRGLRMYWKISIDGSKPVVRSEGNLDPYDGYVTYRLLKMADEKLHVEEQHKISTVLNREIEEMKGMVMEKYQYYDSTDPLDLGESLWLSSWFPNEEWSMHLRKVALSNIKYLFESPIKSTKRRLAFRDFGTSIGLQTIPVSDQSETTAKIVDNIHNVWKDDLYSRDSDITPVMYCSSLLPGVFNPRVSISEGSSFVVP